MDARGSEISSVRVTELRTEFIRCPSGLTTLHPRLSWRLEAARRGVKQTAYRVWVASSEEELLAGRGDLWDSGRVISSASFDIRYDGQPLQSRQRCYWRVQIWDELDRASEAGAPTWWEMGFLEGSDWSADWLAVEDAAMRADREFGLAWIKGPEPSAETTTKFRLRFAIEGEADATFFASAFGALEFWIDGERLATPPLASFIVGPRPAQKRSMRLSAGVHVFAVSLGPTDPRLAAMRFPAGELAPFLRLCTSDGKMRRINADGWKTALSVEPCWMTPSYDDKAWAPAVQVVEERLEPWPPECAMLLRRVFQPRHSLVRARLYAAALGGYELFVNGARVGDALLSPESTDFRKRALYRVYDVTDAIRSGENVFGAVVGDGWYASYTMITGRYSWGPPPRKFLAQLELTYSDGTRETIATDQHWKLARAPIVSSEIYDGEYYDARLEQPGWSAPSFDDASWEEVEIATKPAVALTAHIAPPIRRAGSLKARSLTEPKPGVFVFDFGQNFAGWCRLSVKGSRGQSVEMRFAEVLAENGEVDQANLRLARQTDTYVLRGDTDGETFEPHFTYHGFRYVQVTGFPGIPEREALEGVVVHSDLEVTGEFNVDNPLIEQLWRNTLWSQKSNFVGVPTDCPQRDERMGWLGDANVFWDAAAFNMDVCAFTRRFLDDVRDAQSLDGAFSDFAPAAFSRPVSAPDEDHETEGPSPGWADAGICLPWTIWRRYGDTNVIEENWNAMARYLAFIEQRNSDGVWRRSRGSDFGDWLALDAVNPGDPTTPKDLVATALWAHSLHCIAEMAEATKRTREASAYRTLRRQIEHAFVAGFVAADGVVGNGSQTGYILALRFNLLPEHLRARAAAHLVGDIRRRGGVLSTGFIGTPHSLDVLTDAGYGGVVYDLLLRTDYPSWSYMVAKGATTIWERWNSDVGDLSMNSFNHYALGAVSGFLFRRVSGIAPLAPGFRKIEIRPLLDARVKSAGARYTSVLGLIETAWQRQPGQFDLAVTIPPNASALVHLPATAKEQIMEGGAPLQAGIGVIEQSDSVALDIGSGVYRFEVRRSPLLVN